MEMIIEDIWTGQAAKDKLTILSKQYANCQAQVSLLSNSIESYKTKTRILAQQKAKLKQLNGVQQQQYQAMLESVKRKNKQLKLIVAGEAVVILLAVILSL